MADFDFNIYRAGKNSVAAAGYDHDPIADDFLRVAERVIASRMAARERIVRELAVGILSGREGADRAWLAWTPDHQPVGTYGSIADWQAPYTIVEQVPLPGYTHQTYGIPGSHPLVVMTIPRRWVLLDDAATAKAGLDVYQPITQLKAAKLIDDDAVQGDYTVGGIGHLRLNS